MLGGCSSGCKHYTGGEVYHIKECIYYPDSFSKMYDDLKERERRLTKIIEDENRRRCNDSMDPFQMN